MKTFRYFILASLLTLAFTACDDDDDYSITEVDAPVLLSSSPSDGETNVDPSTTTITLTFDKNIFFASSNASQITLNSQTATKAVVYGSSETLTITAQLEAGTTYTLTVPDGLITGPNSTQAGAVSISFTTQSYDLNTSLCNSSATAEAQSLFAEMLANYGSTTYSGAMAEVSWNNDNAEQVYAWTGKYPAINCYDYLHLPSSPSDWIDYGDITPVQEWHDAGGIVAAMWHWNVPTSEGGDSSFSADGSDFSVADALTDGTWENEFLYEDMEKISEYLLLLQDAGIPVLWRPLHEASGGWFWWGTDGAESYISLWRTMYDYFLAKGINNLIWVWNSCEGEDTDWYPGDDYVDIVSVDMYSQTDTSELYSLYNTLTNQYPDKMVALSECGSVAEISAQWSAGCRWLWFMPWYDSDGVTHADEAWWTDAMEQDYVTTR